MARDWWIDGRPELAIPVGRNVERFVLPGDWVEAGQVVARVYGEDGVSFVRDIESPIAGVVVGGNRPGALEVHGPANSEGGR